jgi:hypothetical protein
MFTQVAAGWRLGLVFNSSMTPAGNNVGKYD